MAEEEMNLDVPLEPVNQHEEEAVEIEMHQEEKKRKRCPPAPRCVPNKAWFGYGCLVIVVLSLAATIWVLLHSKANDQDQMNERTFVKDQINETPFVNDQTTETNSVKDETTETSEDKGYYLIQISGGAAQHFFDLMGRYTQNGDEVEGYPVYEKDGVYLYVAHQPGLSKTRDIRPGCHIGRWIVGKNTSSTVGWLHHPDRQPTPNIPPLVGWMYSNNGSHDDNTLTVKHIGGDKQLQVFYRVSSSGDAAKSLPDQMTDYYPTGDTANGFPVFRRAGNYLYMATTGRWMIGPIAGRSRGWIIHLGPQKKPSTPPMTGWLYYNGTALMVDGSLTVKKITS